MDKERQIYQQNKENNDKLVKAISEKKPPVVNVTMPDKMHIDFAGGLEVITLQGKKGDKPIKGVDYFTAEEQQFFVDDIMSHIRIPKDGKDADPVDYSKIEKFVKSQISKIPKPKDGVDGVSPTIDINSIVISVLEQIPEQKEIVIDYDAIKAFCNEQIERMQRSIARPLNSGGPTTRLGEISDVSINNPTNDQVLKYNSTTGKWENGAGGAGSVTDVTAILPLTSTGGVIPVISSSVSPNKLIGRQNGITNPNNNWALTTDSTDDAGSLDGIDTSMTYASGYGVFNGSSSHIKFPITTIGNVGTINIIFQRDDTTTSQGSMIGATTVGVADYIRINPLPGNVISFTVANETVTGTWTTDTNPHMVTLVWDTLTAWKGYLDGVLVVTGSGVQNPTTTGYLVAGIVANGTGIYTSGQTYFKGKLKLASYWNIRITPSDITSIYNSGSYLTYPFSASGVMQEITLGTGLSLSGTTLNASVSGGITSVVAGTNISVDATDPANPVVSSTIDTALLVPYTGADKAVLLGNNSLTADGILAAPQTYSENFIYGSGGYNASGIEHGYKVYAYKTIGSRKIYSTPFYFTATDDNSFIDYNVDVAWGTVTGADGYMVAKYNSALGWNFDYFIDTTFTTLSDTGTGIWTSGGYPFAYSVTNDYGLNTLVSGAWLGQSADLTSVDFDFIRFGQNGSSKILKWSNAFSSFLLMNEDQTPASLTVSSINASYVYGTWLGNAIDLASQTTGTLPVSKGGTGTTTTFTAKNIIFAGAGGVYSQDTGFAYDSTNNFLGISNSVLTAAAKVHVDAGNATASSIKFTAGTTTGQTATDGVDFGIATNGDAEIRQRENLALNIYTNNVLRGAWGGSTGSLVITPGTGPAVDLKAGSGADILYARNTAGTLVMDWGVDGSGNSRTRLRNTSASIIWNMETNSANSSYFNIAGLGIGTTSPNANAMLDVVSTTKAFIPPRMTTTQKNAIASPTAGMVVYDTTLGKLALYTTVWELVTSV